MPTSPPDLLHPLPNTLLQYLHTIPPEQFLPLLYLVILFHPSPSDLLNLSYNRRVRNFYLRTQVREIRAMEGEIALKTFAETIFVGGRGVPPCGVFYCDRGGVDEFSATGDRGRLWRSLRLGRLGWIGSSSRRLF